MATEKTQKNAKKYICEKCDYNSSNKTDYMRHINTIKHKNNVLATNGNKKTQKTQKNAKKRKEYICEKCDYNSSNKTDYMRHINTITHKNNVLAKNVNTYCAKKYICECCEKEYNDRTGLWKHSKNCNIANKNIECAHQNELPKKETIDKDYLLIELLKQNKELLEIVKNGTHNNNNNTTNSHNKSFNLQFFLNETCKDAMNISEFIEVVKSKVDMMEIYQHGYVNGISKLFIDELKSMEVTERPLHCTDERRNTFYVHNNDAWKKDEDLKDTKKAISHVSQTNLQQCVDWSKNVPDEDSARDDHITKSISICKEACSGNDKNNEKIIKNISKEIVLNKQIISDILV